MCSGCVGHIKGRNSEYSAQKHEKWGVKCPNWALSTIFKRWRHTSPQCHYDVIMASLWRHIDIKIEFLSFFVIFYHISFIHSNLCKKYWNLMKWAILPTPGPSEGSPVTGWSTGSPVPIFFSPSAQINFRKSCKKTESQIFRFSGYSAKTTWVGNFAPPPCGIGLIGNTLTGNTNTSVVHTFLL